jgi:membrane protein DedA with SNARE-associated domain
LVLLEVLQPLVNFIVKFISDIGYPGIFFLSFLESALIPIPSEIVMPFSGFLVSSGKLGFIDAVMAGTLGNLAGSIATYYLGKKLGRTFFTRKGHYFLFSEKHLELTERLFAKHGNKLTFIGRLLPAVRTYISLPAGIGKTRFSHFAGLTFAGSLVWNFLLVYAGVQLGNNWKNIDKYSIYLDAAAAIAVVVLAIWFIRNSKRTNTTVETGIAEKGTNRDENA